MTFPRRRVAAGVAAGLLLTACTATDGGSAAPPAVEQPSDNDTSQPDPAPDPEPEPEPDPAPDPEPLDEQTAIERFLAWNEVTVALPLVAQDEVPDVNEVAGEVAVPGSQAELQLANFLEQASEVGVVERGEVTAEVIELDEVDADTVDAVLCVQFDLTSTDVETGEALLPVDLDRWQAWNVSYQRNGNSDGWLVAHVFPKQDDRDCVPPTIASEVTANWEAFTDAWNDQEAASDGHVIDALRATVSERMVELLENSPPRAAIDDPAPHHDLELQWASRDEVYGTWCRTFLPRAATWVLEDERWVVDFGPVDAGEEVDRCD